MLGHVGARGTAYWNVRLLDQSVRLRRDPRAFAPAESRDAFAERLVARPRQAGGRDRRLGIVRARRRHRRRGVAPAAAAAAAAHGMDQARRVRGPLRHDERRRALAHRHHGQDGRRRLGPVQGGTVRQPARARRSGQAVRSARCTPSWARSSPAASRGRERDDETILLWHRGLSLSDIALGAAMLAQGAAHGHRAALALSMSAPRSPTRGCTRSTRRWPRRGARCCEWVVARADVDFEVIDYPAPQPLPALWARRSRVRVHVRLSAIATRQPQPRVLAAPIPSPRRVSRRGRSTGPTSSCAIDSADHAAANDLRPHGSPTRRRFAIGLSGAARALRASMRSGRIRCSPRPSGPLVTPRRVVEAVLAGDADAGPLDSYVHDLMRLHEPRLAAPLRVDRHDAADADPAAGCGARHCRPSTPTRIARRPAGGRGSADAWRRVRAALLLRGFAPASADDYRVLRADARGGRRAAATAGRCE